MVTSVPLVVAGAGALVEGEATMVAVQGLRTALDWWEEEGGKGRREERMVSQLVMGGEKGCWGRRRWGVSG